MAAVAAGVYAEGPAPPRGAGRMLPRVAPPPPNLPTLLHQLGVGSVVWYAVAIAFPFMVWATRRVDADRLGRLRTVALAVGAVLVLAAGTVVVQHVVVYRGAAMRPGLVSYLPVALAQNLLPWIAAVGIVAVIEGRRRAVHAVVERERLRAEIAEHRLVALTSQLHPHFLFNTLQSISTLIHRDAEAADEMLAKLSELLRDVLRHRDQVFVPLGDELRYARTYLEIAQLRFADRLTFLIDVPDGLDDALVPIFILQPLVENALAHGIGARAEGGRITLTVRRSGDRMRMEVADDGVGLPSGAGLREGIGLSNTRERLRATYGAEQSFALEARNGGGVVASLTVPYRRAGAASTR